MLDLLAALDGIGVPQVLVLGDLILDRYTRGAAERVSPEAPVLVLRADRHETRPGGAAAVAALARGLDARVRLLGVVGTDTDGIDLRAILADEGIDISGVLEDQGRPTTTKDRFLGGTTGTQPYPLLRVDRESRQPLPAHLEERLLAHLGRQLPDCQAVLVADYGKGVCGPRLLAKVVAAAARQGVPVLIDPARLAGPGRYRHARLLLPNRAEAELATGMTIRTPQDACRAGRKLRAHCEAEGVLVKLDGDGMVLVLDGEPGEHFPTRPRAATDGTGAGDMVLAVVGLCQAAGLGWRETVRLANVAAGLEVAHPGVTPVSRAEIRAELGRTDSDGETKLVTVEQLVTLAESYRRARRRVVLTNGCFDLLHAGHVGCLREAARLGDVLVVALNSDASVRRLKGPGRPIHNQTDRAGLVAALACVDHVTVFEDDTPHDLLRRLRPDVLVKGGTYTPEEVVGREVVEAYGGKVLLTAKRDGVSTTRLLTALRAAPVLENVPVPTGPS
jgi:D-beta-D-heptose 7-phosphate kinase/D-beta-D-heptose 1-phosphate adenosyltransferase